MKVRLTVRQKFESCFELELGKDITQEQYDKLCESYIEVRDHAEEADIAIGLTNNWKDCYPADSWVEIEIEDIKEPAAEQVA